MKHLREYELNPRLQRRSQQHVPHAHKRNLPPPPLRPSLLLTDRERNLAMLLEPRRDARQNAVEEQEPQGRENVENGSDSEGAEEFYFQGREGKHEGRPG